MAERTRLHSLPVLFAATVFALGVAMILLRPTEDDTPPRAAVSKAHPAIAETSAETPLSASQPEPGRSEILPTALPLTLHATMVSENPSLSLATIADEEHGTRPVLASGQSLPHRPEVTLHRVERERVLIDNRGVVESLVMVRAEAAALSPPFDIGDEESIRRRVIATRIPELTERGFERREAPLAERSRIALLSEGSITPIYGENDVLAGVEVGDIEEGGIYDRMGLQEGDVLTSVNGISFSDPAAAASVLVELSLSDEIEVGVTRSDGGDETLAVPTGELLEYLRDLEGQVGNAQAGKPE